MSPSPQKLLTLAVILFSAHMASAQQTQTIHISEPGVYKLSELFRNADTVALVKVVSGDAENYDRTVYKAEVVKGFKAAEVGETIYFGPYTGVRLGWEYVLFLRNVAKPLVPKTTSNASYGTVRYSEVFDEGYSSMETSYECIFDGKEVREHCDYGVRVCTDYIVLPKSLPAFPPMTEEPPFGCRWVRKTLLISVLGSLRGSLE